MTEVVTPPPPVPEPAEKPETDPFASGRHTSEWTVTKIALVVGAVLEALATGIHSLQAGGVNATWFAMALAVIGVVLQAATFFGYQKGRATVKAAAITADAVVNAAANRAGASTLP